jgi:SagB-type dehydrogenase family enzyme
MRDIRGEKGAVMKSSHHRKPEEMGIGERFQQETKYDPRDMGDHILDWSNRPEPCKHYESPLAIVPLPQPYSTEKTDLWQLLLHRRSRRSYEAGGTIKPEHLSTLLWATQGITAGHGEFLFRTAPSAGGLYPIETYLSIRAVEGLEPGIYHFRPQAFDLELVRRGDYSEKLAEAALGQAIVRKAHATFIWSAVTARSKWKYRQRAYRYLYLDAGHIAENLYLAGEALDLGVCGIGALFDDMVNELVGLDGFEETVVYMATVGRTGKGGAYDGSHTIQQRGTVLLGDKERG